MGENNEEIVATTGVTKTSKNKKNSNIVYIIVIALLIIGFGLYICYDKGIIFKTETNDKSEKTNNNESKTKETSDNTKQSSDITVYWNGELSDSSNIKLLSGKYVAHTYDGSSIKDAYMVISDKINECEINDPNALLTVKGSDMVSMKIYFFSDWKHLESEKSVDNFVIEFNVKDKDFNNIRNYIYYGFSGPDSYMISEADTSMTYFFER
jgi:hypothetical protein